MWKIMQFLNVEDQSCNVPQKSFLPGALDLTQYVDGARESEAP
jgi:hypothetical protein